MRVTDQVVGHSTGVPGLTLGLYIIYPGLKTLFYKNVGHTVAQLGEALRYKPEGRGFDSRCHRNFSLP
jgi:hypothetical protein